MKLSNILKNTTYILFLTFFVFMFVCRLYIIDYSIQHNKQYTIAYTIQKTFARGLIGIEYKYSVNNIEYYGNSKCYNNTIVPNGRYYVVFSKKRPQWSFILLDNLVPGNIKFAPPEGWGKLPD